MIPNIHQCEFCSATFVNEKNLEKHSCKFMKRYEHVTKKKKGISAYNFYIKWLKTSGKSVKYIDKHSFIHSTQYNHFVSFVDFLAEKGIPDANLYIAFMISKDLLPQHWKRDDALEEFLEYYDCDISPKKHIEKSVDTIMRVAEALECEPSEIFEHLDNNTVLILVQARKISPWLLLNSTKFKQYLRERASAKERNYIQKHINPAKWKEILKKNEHLLPDIRLILKELEL